MKGTFVVIGTVVGVFAIGFGIWALTLALRAGTAPIRGQVGAFGQQQSALNRVQQQAKFEQLAADFDGYLVQIANARLALKQAQAATRPERETELIGLRQICVTTAQDFNAESRKYLARVWKSAGLPERLDPITCSTGGKS